MSNEKQHTPEPWAYNKATFRIWSEGNGQYDGNDPIICNISVQHMQPTEAHANAERIVECVNACEGMIDPANEIMALRKALDNIKQRQLEAERERDELIEAIEQMLSRFNESQCNDTWDKKAVFVAKQAISKAKGGTNG